LIDYNGKIFEGQEKPKSLVLLLYIKIRKELNNGFRNILKAIQIMLYKKLDNYKANITYT